MIAVFFVPFGLSLCVVICSFDIGVVFLDVLEEVSNFFSTIACGIGDQWPDVTHLAYEFRVIEGTLVFHSQEEVLCKCFVVVKAALILIVSPVHTDKIISVVNGTMRHTKQIASGKLSCSLISYVRRDVNERKGIGVNPFADLLVII